MILQYQNSIHLIDTRYVPSLPAILQNLQTHTDQTKIFIETQSMDVFNIEDNTCLTSDVQTFAYL